MRGVLHAEVFGFNFSADINPYQRSDDCVIAAGQITERPDGVNSLSPYGIDPLTLWHRPLYLMELDLDWIRADPEHPPFC